MKSEIIIAEKQLPTIIERTIPSVGSILNAFNLPRNVIASDEEIQYAWKDLPREIARIPPELKDGLIARMCIAISVGLFDGAINYIWNAVIVNLRLRIKSFGLGYVSQALDKKFEEDDLNNLTVSDILELCHKLELLPEEGFFFLNQCRDIRNNFSTAHPTMAQIDDKELINFISRCCKFGINSDYTLKGIHITEFINTIKAGILSQDSLDMWTERLSNTFTAQRVLLISMLHGIYCDPNSNEEVRINALQICTNIKNMGLFDSKLESSLIDQHNNYRLKNNEDKIKTSQVFFQKMGLFDLLTTVEKHSIIKNTVSQLFRVHQEFNNFYNEPPFAKNLLDITNGYAVPKTVQEEFVQAVITCYVGNRYGVSDAAIPYYEQMIKNFSPNEIAIMLDVFSTKTIVADRINQYPDCRKRFVEAVLLLNTNSVTPELNVKLITIKKRFGDHCL